MLEKHFLRVALLSGILVLIYTCDCGMLQVSLCDGFEYKSHEINMAEE